MSKMKVVFRVSVDTDNVLADTSGPIHQITAFRSSKGWMVPPCADLKDPYLKLAVEAIWSLPNDCTSEDLAREMNRRYQEGDSEC